MAHGAQATADTVSGWTPLHYAAKNGDKVTVQLLIAKGADVHARTKVGREDPLWVEWKGRTPLHVAASEGHFDVAELLIAGGADVRARDDHGVTPLHEAAGRGPYGSPQRRFDDVAELLLAKGADVNAKNTKGQTPLDCARQSGGPQGIELLTAAARNAAQSTPTPGARQ